MAGSYKHCVNDDGSFRGVDLLDHLGDAHEALEEMYGMIWYLADELAGQYAASTPTEIIERARQDYRRGLDLSP